MSVFEIIKFFWHDSDETNLQAVKGSKGRFDLMLGTLLVGVLLYEDGIWSFSYSEDYKNQNQYEPLVNFPTRIRGTGTFIHSLYTTIHQ